MPTHYACCCDHACIACLTGSEMMPTRPFRSAPRSPGFTSSAASRALLRRRARSGSTALLSAGSSPSAASPCMHMPPMSISLACRQLAGLKADAGAGFRLMLAPGSSFFHQDPSPKALLHEQMSSHRVVWLPVGISPGDASPGMPGLF